MGMFMLLTACLLLTQCSMPSRQAWQYIQTHGLLTYWQYESQHASPPFRTGVSRHMPRYATTSRNSLAVPRYSHLPSSSWSSFWGYDRTPYYYSQNRYYNQTPSSTHSSGSYNPRPSRPPSSHPSPRTTIPLEEPSGPPQIGNTTAPQPDSAPKTSGPASSPAKTAADLPFGTPVPGRANMVNSPYAGQTQLVDVSGMGPGQTVKCPYTGKLFKVPSAQQAENKAEPRQESKIDP
jgi:hypothetical protein